MSFYVFSGCKLQKSGSGKNATQQHLKAAKHSRYKFPKFQFHGVIIFHVETQQPSFFRGYNPFFLGGGLKPSWPSSGFMGAPKGFVEVSTCRKDSDRKFLSIDMEAFGPSTTKHSEKSKNLCNQFSGWWLNNSSEKCARQIGNLPQIGVNIKNVSNHHLAASGYHLVGGWTNRKKKTWKLCARQIGSWNPKVQDDNSINLWNHQSSVAACYITWGWSRSPGRRQHSGPGRDGTCSGLNDMT